MTYDPVSPYAKHRRFAIHDPTEIDAIERRYARLYKEWQRLVADRPYEDATLDNLAQPPEVLEVVSQHFDIEHRNDLVVLGDVGVGKSYLAYAIAREHWFAERSPRIISALDLEKAELDELISCRRLIIDDLGAERSTPTHEETLFRIFDGRWQRTGGTVITSNLVPGEFITRIGERNFDRLNGPIVVLSGTSRRKHPVELDVSDTADFDDALARVREYIRDDEMRRSRWAFAVIAEGLFELFDPRMEWVLDAQSAAFESAVRFCFEAEADALLYGEPPTPAQEEGAQTTTSGPVDDDFGF